MCMSATTCIDELLDEIMFPKKETKIAKLSVEDSIMLLEDDIAMAEEDIEYCLGKIRQYQAELKNLESRKKKA